MLDFSLLISVILLISAILLGDWLAAVLCAALVMAMVYIKMADERIKYLERMLDNRGVRGYHGVHDE